MILLLVFVVQAAGAVALMAMLIVTASARSRTMGALIIRIGFWGPFYYIYIRKPLQKIVWVIV